MTGLPPDTPLRLGSSGLALWPSLPRVTGLAPDTLPLPASSGLSAGTEEGEATEACLLALAAVPGGGLGLAPSSLELSGEEPSMAPGLPGRCGRGQGAGGAQRASQARSVQAEAPARPLRLITKRMDAGKVVGLRNKPEGAQRRQKGLHGTPWRRDAERSPLLSHQRHSLPTNAVSISRQQGTRGSCCNPSPTAAQPFAALVDARERERKQEQEPETPRPAQGAASKYVAASAR